MYCWYCLMMMKYTVRNYRYLQLICIYIYLCTGTTGCWLYCLYTSNQQLQVKVYHCNLLLKYWPRPLRRPDAYPSGGNIFMHKLKQLTDVRSSISFIRYSISFEEILHLTNFGLNLFKLYKNKCQPLE